MLSLLYVALYAAFGFLGGIALRRLRERAGKGFTLAHWAICGGTIALALAFARFVISRRGLFGSQPEMLLYIGVALMVPSPFQSLA